MNSPWTDNVPTTDAQKAHEDALHREKLKTIIEKFKFEATLLVLAAVSLGTKGTDNATVRDAMKDGMDKADALFAFLSERAKG